MVFLSDVSSEGSSPFTNPKNIGSRRDVEVHIALKKINCGGSP